MAEQAQTARVQVESAFVSVLVSKFDTGVVSMARVELELAPPPHPGAPDVGDVREGQLLEPRHRHVGVQVDI